jgi:hypothetical protein
MLGYRAVRPKQPFSGRRHAAAIALSAATLVAALRAAATPPMATLVEPRPPVPAQTSAKRDATSQKPRESPWVETSSGGGIMTWKREVAGSPIIDLLGEGIVEAPVVRVASVLLDYTRATEWIDSLEEVRVVRMVGPLEFIEYDHVGTPPIIMKDRDFVCRGKLALDLQEQSLVMTIEPTSDPALPPTRYIRGELRGYWKLKAMDGGKRTFVIAEMHGDPKGGVPKWLVNLFQKGWARNTIESLREQVAKPDIKIMPQVKAAFEGKPIALAIKSK